MSLRDTGRVMAEESTTPDLVARVRQSVRAGSERDIDRSLAFYAPDAVWDMSPWGIGIFEGTEAVRSFFEDWLGRVRGVRLEAEEIVDLGNGVVFAVLFRGVARRAAAATFNCATRPWAYGWTVCRYGPRTIETSTRPVLPPNASPRNGGRRCRRTWILCARSMRTGNAAKTSADPAEWVDPEIEFVVCRRT